MYLEATEAKSTRRPRSGDLQNTQKVHSNSGFALRRLRLSLVLYRGTGFSFCVPRLLRIRTVALFELLARSARARIVAANFFPTAALDGFARLTGPGHACLLQLAFLAPLKFLFQ